MKTVMNHNQNDGLYTSSGSKLLKVGQGTVLRPAFFVNPLDDSTAYLHDSVQQANTKTIAKSCHMSISGHPGRCNLKHRPFL